MTKHTIHAWTAAALVVLLPFSAAALTATESFTYGDGDLNGKGSAGGGWAGAWQAVSGAVTLLVSGNEAVSFEASSLKSYSARNLAGSIFFTNGAPTVWISLKMKIDLVEPLGNSQDGVGLVWAGDVAYGVFGRLNDPAGNKKWSIWPLNASPWYHFATEDIPDDVWSDVCMKYKSTGAGTGTYTMWVNPNYALTEYDPAQVAPVLVGAFNHNSNTELVGVSVGSDDKETGTTSYWDDLRISNESSPFAPSEGFIATEPFTYSDGSLNGKGLAAYGWAGAWRSSGDASMLVSGNEAVSDPPVSGTTRSLRDLEESLFFTSGAPAVWISLKLKIDLVEPLGNSWDGVGLIWAGDVAYGAFARMNDPAGNKKWSVYSLNASPWYHFAAEDVPDNVWSDVCVKYEPTGAGTGTYTMWVDPNYALAEQAFAQTVPVLTQPFNHNGNTELVAVTVGSSDADSGTKSYWDDLRIATITPFVIPPRGTLIVLQ